MPNQGELKTRESLIQELTKWFHRIIPLKSTPHEIGYQPLFSKIPIDASSCWKKLKTFREHWYPNDQPIEDIQAAVQMAESRLELKLPATLIEWHQNLWPSMFGHKFSARVLPLNELYISKELLVVRTEYVFNGKLLVQWGIRLENLGLEDPPVEMDMLPKIYPVADRLSKFAIYCAAYDTVRPRKGDDIIWIDIVLPADARQMEFQHP